MIRFENRAVPIVLAAAVIDIIGFGIVMPVLPGLVTQLGHMNLTDATRTAGWMLAAFRRCAILRRTGARQSRRRLWPPPGADRVDGRVRARLRVDGVGADAGVAVRRENHCWDGWRDLRAGRCGDRRRDPARQARRSVRLAGRRVRRRVHYRAGAGRAGRGIRHAHAVPARRHPSGRQRGRDDPVSARNAEARKTAARSGCAMRMSSDRSSRCSPRATPRRC